MLDYLVENEHGHSFLPQMKNSLMSRVSVIALGWRKGKKLNMLFFPDQSHTFFDSLIHLYWSESTLPWLDKKLDWSECLGPSGIWTSFNEELCTTKHYIWLWSIHNGLWDCRALHMGQKDEDGYYAELCHFFFQHRSLNTPIKKPNGSKVEKCSARFCL